MKKISVLLLSSLLLTALLLQPVYADSPETLIVQTRSGNFVFHTGDTFVYNYWIELSPDVAQKLGVSESYKLSVLENGILDEISCNLLYDPAHLEIVSKSMPNFHRSIIYEKKDLIGGTILDGTLFDFTENEIFFKAMNINSSESVLFRDRQILVSVKFRVKSGNRTPVYLRTKVKKLEMTLLGKTIPFIDDKNSIAICPFASYETIGSAKPTTLLSPYVSDQAFDVRCCRTSGDTEAFLRPGAGVAITLDGVSVSAEHIRMTEYTTEENVFWFYDIPYGEYYVSCSYVSGNGTRYETDSLSHGEFVSIPSTGEIQALWLFEAAPLVVSVPDSPVTDGIAYADGISFPLIDSTVTLDKTDYRTLVVCSFSGSDPTSESVYPVHMYVWTLSYQDGAYTAQRHTLFDDLLQYAGSSIRISGKKGIRMITGVPDSVKRSLIAGTGDGYLLIEYGTLVAWEDDLAGGALTLDSPGVKSAYAYKRNTADPVYRRSNGTVQYTNVLVGFSTEQCIPRLAMRPYMKLQDKLGQTVILYGGVVMRSIGYIAYQNRTVFSPGGSSYAYIWDIIHSVYGNAFDSEYFR